MLPSLTVISPQGVGDCIWTLRKCLPIAHQVNFKIIDPGHSPRQITRRAEAILKEIPGVGTVEYIPFDDKVENVDWITQDQVTLKQLIDPILAADMPPNRSTGVREIKWAANPWLESYHCLENIDPEFEVRWDLKIPRRPVEKLDKGTYLCVYVSGDTVRHKHLGEKVWTVEEWGRLVDRTCLYNGLGTNVLIVLIGATFDYPALATLSDVLISKGFRTRIECDLPLPELMTVLGDAICFIGYQSGLSILADETEVRNHIIYFPRLMWLTDVWAKPQHRQGRRLTWSFFNVGFDTTASQITVDTPRLKLKQGR